MFTGIVETTGQVLDLRETPGGRRVNLDVSGLSGELSQGESVAVNGVCLTVVESARQRCSFDVIKETLDRSNFADLRVGGKVNLERSMSATSRFDGHFVQGHVDAVATVDRIISTSAEWVVWLRHDAEITPLIIPKGSVSVDGVSLTVADTKPETFSVALIPTTLELTNMSDLRAGDRVNIETDILARTLHHQMQLWFDDSNPGELLGKLKERGFA